MLEPRLPTLLITFDASFSTFKALRNFLLNVFVYLYVELQSAGEGLQQHEEADRKCKALWCACGGSSECFQVSDGW